MLDLWVTAERLPELLAIHPEVKPEPSITPPASRARSWTREDAMIEILRGRMTLAGPATAAELARLLSVEIAPVEAALLALESEGVVLRGHFSGPGEWCDRALLARIHRYTLNRLRAEIQPVSPADFMRFLFRWQHAEPSARLSGADGLRAVVAIVDGFEAAAASWERAILPQRMDRYDPPMLDTLCLAGEAGWARLSTARNGAGGPTTMSGATPVSLFLREHRSDWERLGAGELGELEASIGDNGKRIREFLLSRGASFFRDIVAGCGLPEQPVREAIGELASAGLVASDGFAGLRALIRGHGNVSERAGRWSAIRIQPDAAAATDAAIETQAWSLLRRYGVVFRRLLTRETNPAPWRTLTRVYRRLEARGEIRGGRFVNGMSGEQFALPHAVDMLREVRRDARDGRLIAMSAADPLNLAGILDSGERVRSTPGNRLVYVDGVPVAALEGEYIRPLVGMTGLEASTAAQVATALAGRPLPAVTAGYVGRAL
jgi:ATP-dependent Lhr-like helicase